MTSWNLEREGDEEWFHGFRPDEIAQQVDQEYKCTKCKDNKDLMWGIEQRELCLEVWRAYDTIAGFKPNLRMFPSNKTGKDFYDLFADALEIVDKIDTKIYNGWNLTTMIHPICLQNADHKSTQKQRTEKMWDNIERI